MMSGDWMARKKITHPTNASHVSAEVNLSIRAEANAEPAKTKAVRVSL